MLHTAKTLYPANAEELELLDPSDALKAGNPEVWIVVDDGAQDHPWVEFRPLWGAPCRTM